MILTLLAAAVITTSNPVKQCDAVLFYNSTSLPFNEFDQKMYDFNKKRCGKGAYMGLPCVKYFRKVGERDYHLVCTTTEASKWEFSSERK